MGERRAADQARLSMVSAAVDWLFSAGGRSLSVGGNRRQSAPPGGRAPPPRTAASSNVPQIDLGTLHQQNGDRQRSMPRELPAAAPSASSRPARLSTSRPAPLARLPIGGRELAQPSRDESPQTPPAVHLQRREEAFREQHYENSVNKCT